MFLLDRELQFVIFSLDKKIQIVSGFAAAFSRDSRYVIYLLHNMPFQTKRSVQGALTIFLVRARACQFQAEHEAGEEESLRRALAVNLFKLRACLLYTS